MTKRTRHEQSARDKQARHNRQSRPTKQRQTVPDPIPAHPADDLDRLPKQLPLEQWLRLPWVREAASWAARVRLAEAVFEASGLTGQDLDKAVNQVETDRLKDVIKAVFRVSSG